MINMRHFNFLLLPLTFLLVSSCTIPPPRPDAQTILQNSQAKHDPDALWSEMEFQLHIQEPRVGNTARFSKVYLNNASGVFQLKRNRDSKIATYAMDEDGSVKVLLNGSESYADSLAERYRLDPSGVPRYQEYYQVMFGLPMTLNDALLAQLGAAQKVYYNKTPCYKIPVSLQQALFSKEWIIYISQKDFTFKGIEIIFPDDPQRGERVYFDGEIAINGISIPRYRHWHEYHGDAYSGSDIIVERL
jgi:hypothetical protein